MKVVVRFCEDKSKEIEIEIDENCDVKNVKLMIEKLTETNEKYTADYFHIFHRNIILDNDRMVKFYAIEENDEIYIGKIKHYLQIDDEIVELFVIGDNLSFEYVVVKRNDKISQLKLLINRIIPDLVTVWSFNGYEMKDDQIISDILIMNKFYKFLVGCRIINDLLYNYFKIHDQYLVSSYAKKQKISFWSLDLYDEKEILQLKEKLIELKNSLENREIIPKLNESLSNIPLPFIRSRYLFCMNTADEIWDICRDYWSNMIGQQCIHRFIRDIFRVELNEELLIYSNIDSNMENIIDAALDFSCGNENILINIISKSMAALLWKYDEMLGSLCDIWNESIDLISFNQVDYINGISENLISDIKTKFIIGYEDPLIYDEIRNECIDKYKQNMYNLLIDIDKEMKPNKTKSKATMNTKYINFMLTNQLDFKEIIKKSVGKILNFIQRYVGNKVIKNGHLEEILRNHIVCLLREYLNVTISRIDIIRHSTWNETEINEIVNKSIKRMFIRIALINYAEAKSGLCNVTTNMSYDENSLNDVMNEFLEKKIIKDEMMETLFGLLPGDVEFEKFMKNGIDRLISEQKFDYIHEDIMKESAKLFIDSKFSKSKFIEESARQIFDSLLNNDKVYEVINKKNTFYSQNCDITNNIKQYMISSLIKDSRFQEIFKNKMIYRER